MELPVEAERFGAQLRQTRRRIGLSQVELGGNRYSGSYISYLESGRRVATAEVIEFLCDRMGVAPAELGIGVVATPAVSNVDALEALLDAERAWRDRDFPAASRFAGRAADAARLAEMPDREWQALYLQAQALYYEGHFIEGAEVATSLVTHSVSEHAPQLRAQALALSSVCYRAGDRLHTALAAAMRAVQLASEAAPALQAEALMALLSALAELGAGENEVRGAALRLEQVVERLESENARGIASWTLGTIYFRLGENDEGMRWHNAAYALINPDRDFRQWVRLQRTMASCRLDAGIRTGVVELLNNAERGLALVGNPIDKAELALAQAKFQLLEGRPADAATLAASILRSEHTVDQDLLSGEAIVVQGDAYAALGRPSEALHAYQKAAAVFEKHGSWRLISLAWRRATTLSEQGPVKSLDKTSTA